MPLQQFIAIIQILAGFGVLALGWYFGSNNGFAVTAVVALIDWVMAVRRLGQLRSRRNTRERLLRNGSAVKVRAANAVAVPSIERMRRNPWIIECTPIDGEPCAERTFTSAPVWNDPAVFVS